MTVDYIQFIMTAINKCPTLENLRLYKRYLEDTDNFNFSLLLRKLEIVCMIRQMNVL